MSKDDDLKWFVMRDLTRPIAKLPAYLMLKDMGIEFYTPIVSKVVTRGGKRVRKQMPFIHDLIFVHGSRSIIDPIVRSVPTFQYRFMKKRELMTVREADMERFIKAVESTPSPRYYRPEEITPEMLRRKIHIIGGQLDGYEGFLITTRGSKVKRLLVELPSLLVATVEVEPEFIRLIEDK